MTRKFKTLGLVLVSVLALSAAGASGASAATEFHYETSPVTLTGSQEGESNAFDVQFGEVKCGTAKYTGKTPTGTVDITVTISVLFENCTFAGVASTVDLNGCHFLIHLQNVPVPFRIIIDVVCPAGQEITVTGGTKCTLHIPAQTGLGPATVTNIGAGATREVTAALAGIQNITYTQTPGTGVGKCSSITSSTGKYTGTSTFTGENEAGTAHIGVFVA
jgi:hypothetical protein